MGGRGGKARKSKGKASNGGGDDQTAKHMQILKKLLNGPSGEKVWIRLQIQIRI